MTAADDRPIRLRLAVDEAAALADALRALDAHWTTGAPVKPPPGDDAHTLQALRALLDVAIHSATSPERPQTP